jgi:hypothetical protein
VIAGVTDAVARYPRWGFWKLYDRLRWSRCTGGRTAVRVDNGPEFTAQPFVDWCAEHGIACHYIQPGKPDQNAYIERFNRTYRTEVLNAHLFESIAELQTLTRQWLRVYNQERPHDSLGRVPPLTFLPRPTAAGQSPWELPTSPCECATPSESLSIEVSTGASLRPQDCEPVAQRIHLQLAGRQVRRRPYIEGRELHGIEKYDHGGGPHPRRRTV